MSAYNAAAIAAHVARMALIRIEAETTDPNARAIAKDAQLRMDRVQDDQPEDAP